MSDTRPAAAPALLPERRALCGPVTRRRVVRLWLIYAALFALGLLIAFASADPHWQAFGFGLMVPGGGFFAHADATTVHGLVHLAAGLAALGGRVRAASSQRSIRIASKAGMPIFRA